MHNNVNGDNEVTAVRTMATTLLDFWHKRVASDKIETTAVDVAGMFLLARTREFFQAAVELLGVSFAAPVAIAVLARAQLESAANLLVILNSKLSAEAKKNLAESFIRFGEFNHVRSLEDDLDDYRASLSPTEQGNLDRRIEVSTEVQSTFTPEQERQGRYPTWNGKSITQTIVETGGDGARRWYSLMSLIAHGDPCMLHKSLTITENEFRLFQRDYGVTDAAYWVNRMGKQLFACLLVFLTRNGEIEVDDEIKRVYQTLGIEQSHVND
ncbi:MAG TPA: DUF5677 domain-containing protein [Phycisphaerae bacterium]|nr:DUF5677 domain-containing protein [Phycisphaerae bacterium]